MKIWSALLLAFGLTACAPSPQTSHATTGNEIETDTRLLLASCDANTDRYDAPPLPLSISKVALGTDADIAKALPENIHFVGGWHLTSTNPEFGGLSGLAVLESGDLLAVSDKGYAITIGLTINAPNGEASLMPLLDEMGHPLTSKKERDAEGLAYREGIAFISFERRHRILTFDFGRCGVATRGLPFADLPKAQLGTRIAPNDGAEALDFASDGRVRAGYETNIDGKAPRVTFDTDGQARETAEFVEVENEFKLTGADQGYDLFRAYDRDQGNRNIITGPGVSFRLAPPLTVDNFEGIAVRQTDNGSTQIYLISDDNFSNRQRTLLYLIEVLPSN